MNWLIYYNVFIFFPYPRGKIISSQTQYAF